MVFLGPLGLNFVCIAFDLDLNVFYQHIRIMNRGKKAIEMAQKTSVATLAEDVARARIGEIVQRMARVS